MDNIISRFPGLAEKIFDCLDDESLVNSRTVSRTWSEFTENEMFFLRRIIRKLIDGFRWMDFKDTWKFVMKKADLEMTKELALAVKFFLSKHPGNCVENCDHRTLSYSPLDIGAQAGQATLCEYILQITEDKNPRDEDGWTPLHAAAQEGHLPICEMIMNVIHDKNPADEDGYTPLHAAAYCGHLPICSMIMDVIKDKNPRDVRGSTPLHDAASGGHLDTFKMIMDKAGTDINPSSNGGWTALHYAASNGHKEMYKFIVDQIEEKNPEADDGSTPEDLMWEFVNFNFDS